MLRASLSPGYNFLKLAHKSFAHIKVMIRVCSLNDATQFKTEHIQALVMQNTSIFELFPVSPLP